MTAQADEIGAAETFSALVDATLANRSLGEDRIHALVAGYMSGAVSDDQMAAWMMCVRVAGLDESDTIALANSMAGQRADVPFDMLDKHSTGGVGDKTTIAVAGVGTFLRVKARCK